MKIRGRLAKIQSSMRRNGLDALIVTSTPNIRYLSNFSGSNALVIVKKREAVFVTDSRYTQQCKEEVKGLQRIVTQTSLAEAAADRKVLARCKKVGFESGNVTYAQYRNFRKLFPDASFVSTSNIVEDVAISKDVDEIVNIRKAAAISDRVFSEVIKIIRPGMRELDVSAEISYLHRSLGADADAFETIVASGERGAFPHARASSKHIRSGDLVTLDFGCRVNGYHSDITRTIGVGRLSKELRSMYGVVLDAQCAAVEAARAGISAKDLDSVARNLISAAGYGKYFVHSLGHGLGLQVHEAPRLSSLNDDVLKVGSVVTIEPGIYIHGVGGVRIEDDVLLTESGNEVLTQSSKKLIVV